MSLLVANIAGWILAHWKWLLYIAAGIVFVTVVIMQIRSCNSKPTVKIDEAKVQAVVEQIKAGNRAEAEAVAVEIATKQAAIDEDLSGNLKAIEEKEREVKQTFDAMTNEELAEWFEEQVKQ